MTPDAVTRPTLPRTNSRAVHTALTSGPACRSGNRGTQRVSDFPKAARPACTQTPVGWVDESGSAWEERVLHLDPQRMAALLYRPLLTASSVAAGDG